MVAQKSSNEFVKNQFFNLKTKVKQGLKNQQVAFHEIETKLGRITDQMVARPTGSLPSNTQTNPKPSSESNDKAYCPPPTRIKQVNVVCTRSGSPYNPPINPNDKFIVIYDDCNEEDKEKDKEDNSTPSAPKQTQPVPMKAYKPRISYPQRLRKEKIEEKYGKFINMIKEVRINIPLVDVLVGMPDYDKFLKELVSNKNKLEEISAAFLNEECSAIIQNKIPPKLRDPGSFLIPCTLGNAIMCNALADLGASINLMPYSLYAKISGGTIKPMRMCIRLANQSHQYLVGVAEYMLVQVGQFIFPINFVILEMEEDRKVPLILGRRFLHTANAIIRVKDALLNDSDPFMSTSKKINETDLDRELAKFMEVKFKETPKGEAEEDFEELSLKEKYQIKNPIQDPPTDLEMKPLTDHLEYAYLEKDSLLLVIITSNLKADEKERLVSVLKNHKEAFAWKTSDIPGISSNFCKHKIKFEEDAKPVSHVHRVLKKGGMIVVTNERNELVPTRTVTGWHEKYHFMVTEGIVLDHKVFDAGLEVDKSKIEVISKLPPPTNVKSIRSFLGHAGFYRRFIKEFSKISLPMTKLLEKDVVFDFNEEYIKEFETLKEKLMNAPIMVSPDWS
ncbi:reverse transcriptase domain-containing protein [Tanacetum coccineum]